MSARSQPAAAPADPGSAPHAAAAERVLEHLRSSPGGIDAGEASRRRAEVGPNELPVARPPGLVRLFVRQFRSPLIYVLLFAGALSVAIGHAIDAVLVLGVLLLNAVIGTWQEHRAERGAAALRRLAGQRAMVLRGRVPEEIDARELVPGDVVMVASGSRVPADARLLESSRLRVDESLLTGESMAVHKDAGARVAPDAPLGDRGTLVHAGSLVEAGRGRAVVVATAHRTQLGSIASSLATARIVLPPLVQRMERLTRTIGVIVGIAIVALATLMAARGEPVEEIAVLAVALAVAAIPEGLPVALTIALANSSSRMARRSVIVRRLVAVEALGSCTVIATDKTGTLTVNQLTVDRVVLPGEDPWRVGGEGLVPEGEVHVHPAADARAAAARLAELARPAVLCNEGRLVRREAGTGGDEWEGVGDAVDVALLAFARKLGHGREEVHAAHPQVGAIPYESEQRYAASLHGAGAGGTGGGEHVVAVKGALEELLEMCSRMATLDGERPLDRELLLEQAHALARGGYRVLAVASGPAPAEAGPDEFHHGTLRGLVLRGLVGMIDPLRPEAAAAVERCGSAGISVRMVTGDHPETALAIARRVGIASEPRQVIGGDDLRRALAQPEGPARDGALDELARRGRVFARVEPAHKLHIVQALQRQGEFVAVTGDGANDAPALRAAHVGVAMGRSGTDVAREASDLVLADDDFASIVAGIEEGRIAYANVRKVVTLLVPTALAMLALVAIAAAAGSVVPLLPAQVLWLNLVANGIQDVGLAFEGGEGDELEQSPRAPAEPVFNRLLVERTVIATTVMTGGALALWWLLTGPLEWGVDAARNSVLLLMVLFSNVLTGAARSERHPVLRLNPLRNPILLVGTLAAQLVHIAALYLPGVSDVLRTQPVGLGHWIVLLAVATSLFTILELHKAWWWRRRGDCTC